MHLDDEEVNYSSNEERNEAFSSREIPPEEEEEETFDSSEEETFDSSGINYKKKYLKENQRCKEAHETISNLIKNITEFKIAVSEERKLLEEKLEEEKLNAQENIEVFEQERSKLLEEIKELEGVNQEWEDRIKELEDERFRRNKENLENLQTLLKEMSYIEEMNSGLSTQLEIEKNNHKQTLSELTQANKLVEQLKVKLESQEQQLNNLEKEKSKMEINSKKNRKSMQLGKDLSLENLSEDSLIQKVIQLKHELQEEKSKVQNIHSILKQAFVLSSPSSLTISESSSSHTASLQTEKEAHEKTKKLLEEQQQLRSQDQEKIAKLEKRVRDLIHSHTRYSTITPSYSNIVQQQLQTIDIDSSIGEGTNSPSPPISSVSFSENNDRKSKRIVLRKSNKLDPFAKAKLSSNPSTASINITDTSNFLAPTSEETPPKRLSLSQRFSQVFDSKEALPGSSPSKTALSTFPNVSPSNSSTNLLRQGSSFFFARKPTTTQSSSPKTTPRTLTLSQGYRRFVGWEQYKDLKGEDFWIDQNSQIITRKNPMKPKNNVASIIDPKRIEFLRKTLSPRQVILMQSAIRRWMAKRNLYELTIFYKYRKAIVEKLYESQSLFVKSLRSLFQEFLTPSKEKNLISSNIIDPLFEQIKSILAFSEFLLDSLNNKIQNNWYANQKFGEIFLKLSIHLESYIAFYTSDVYSSISKNLTSIITKLNRKSELKVLSMALDLPNLLSLPLNQIRIYFDLIEQLLKYTFKNSSDYIPLKTAIDKISSHNATISNLIKEKEMNSLFERLQRLFVGAPPLKAEGRYLIKEGSLQLETSKGFSKNAYFVVFNDIMVYGFKEDSKVRFGGLANLNNFSVKEVRDNKNSLSSGSRFEIVTPTESFLVTADSVETKKSWIKCFHSVDLKSTEIKKQMREKTTLQICNPKLDTSKKVCSLCQKLLTSPSSIHSCKKCEKIVCWKCSPNLVKLPNRVIPGRICNECFDTQLSLSKFYLNSKVKLSKSLSYLSSKSNSSTPIYFSPSIPNLLPSSSSPIGILPSSVLVQIFQWLDNLNDLASVSKCCKLWNQISKSDALWRNFFVRKFREPDVIYEQTWKQRFRIEKNWREGRYQTTIFKGHNAPITCLHLEGDFLLSGATDSKIRLWNVLSKQSLSTVLQGHRKSIRQVFLESFTGMAISSSEDKTLRIWDITSEKTMKTIFFGGRDIVSFVIDKEKNTLITASLDANSKLHLKMWDMNRWDMVRSISNTELHDITCMDLRYDTLVIGGSKGVTLWNLGNGQTIQTFPHPSPVSCLQIYQNNIVTGMNSGSCRIYDLVKGEHHTFEVQAGSKVTSLQMDSNKIVTGSYSSGVKVWSLDSFVNEKILYSIPFKGAPLKSMQFEQQILATGHQDNSIRLTNFNQEIIPSTDNILDNVLNNNNLATNLVSNVATTLFSSFPSEELHELVDLP